MDLLNEIGKKINKISDHPTKDGIKAALRHMQVAEKYLFRGREEQDEDLFNDVIYRTNQAFEGMLKEAYNVLTNQFNTKVSPYQIEQHFLSKKLLASRVFELFKNYRQEWRNPSTHDHKLFFNEQEALLAIVSISAFSNILLDQIIEKISLQSEQEEVERKRSIIQAKLGNYNNLSFIDRVITLLNLFSEELKTDSRDLGSMNEIEFLGRLQGFMSALDPSIQSVREPSINGDRQLRPDILLMRDSETIVLELKRLGRAISKSGLEMGRRQMLTYLHAGNYQYCVLYVPPSMPDQQMETKTEGVMYIVAPSV
jgi:hypothetical protein